LELLESEKYKHKLGECEVKFFPLEESDKKTLKEKVYEHENVENRKLAPRSNL
jgi:hypothetical protein